MKFTAIILLLFMAASLTACQSKDKRYLDASLGTNLELPPDLAQFEVQSKFELPKVFSGTDDETARDKIPVLARVESLRLSGSGDLYWLEVEEPVTNLYQLVKNFWASEGYRLEVDEPVIGIMQTEWILKEQGASEGGSSWVKRLFSSEDLSASQDQFRTRIELDQTGRGSRVYITHRGTEFSYTLELKETTTAIGDDDENENEWRFRQPESELEVEMLSRLMIYLGLQKAEVEQQVANVKLFSPRASQHIDVEEKSPFLIVKDPYPIAWNRVYHQLERMNFNIESVNLKGLSGEGDITVKAKVTESKEGGGLFSFSSSSLESVEKRIVLVVAEETHELTRVMIETPGGDFDTSPAGAEFLRLLYQQIK